MPRLGRKRCRELESPPPTPHPGPTPLSPFWSSFPPLPSRHFRPKHLKTRCRRNFRKMCLIYVKKVRSVTCKFKCCGQKLVALFTAFHQPNAGQLVALFTAFHQPNAGQHRAVSSHFLQQGPHKNVEKYADFNRITESMRAFPGQPRFQAAADRHVIDADKR